MKFIIELDDVPKQPSSDSTIIYEIKVESTIKNSLLDIRESLSLYQ